jgi:diphosphomevalonate decarboxylase
LELIKTAWRSPSNIALVKYWGKMPVQIPANPSISMTLNKAYTEMSLDFIEKEKADLISVDFSLDGKSQEKFKQKIETFLQSLCTDHPVLKNFHFKISSRNTFPHSTGIASSASSMSALGLCLAEFLTVKGAIPDEKESFLREASRLARLASGSACRSVYGGYVIWGKAEGMPGTSDEFGVKTPFSIHDSFRDMKDAILVVTSREKSVSSRAGHALMENHPFAAGRFELARKNLDSISNALNTGDFDRFVEITESEALGLHALMMTSAPSYFLIEPNTVIIVNEIRRFRRETGIPVCFTLDAGPNVHLLYPGSYESKVKNWISEELVNYCENGFWIDDGIGNGPEKII